MSAALAMISGTVASRGKPSPTGRQLLRRAPAAAIRTPSAATYSSTGGGRLAASIGSIALLRTIGQTPDSNETVVVEGYAVPGDGGGGIFAHAPTDRTSLDNGGTIIVAGAARWHRLYAGRLEAQWFGAFDDTSDAAPGLQAAISVAKATGQALHLGARAGQGFWLNSSALDCTNVDQLTILGDGATAPHFGLARSPSKSGSVLVGNTGTAGAIIDATGANNFNLQGISLSTLATAGGHPWPSNPSTVALIIGTSNRSDAGAPGGAGVSLSDVAISMAHGAGSRQSFGIYGMSWNLGSATNVMVLADAPCVVGASNPHSITPPFGVLGPPVDSDGIEASSCQFLCYGLNPGVYPLRLEACTDHDWTGIYLNTIYGGASFAGQPEAILIDGCDRVTMTIEVDYLPTVFRMVGVCDQISIRGTTYPNLTPVASNLPLVGLFEGTSVKNSGFFVTADATKPLPNSNYWYSSNGGGSPPATVWNNCTFLFSTAQSPNVAFLNTSSGAPAPFFNLTFNGDTDNANISLEINGSAAGASRQRCFLNGTQRGTG